jgi:hypothetical protein
MTLYIFNGYKGRAEHTFTCPSCGKANRKRSFTVEHTVNPFNKNPDGSVRTASEVSANARAAAKLERDQFATEPLCKACEDDLPYADGTALRKRRRANVEA